MTRIQAAPAARKTTDPTLDLQHLFARMRGGDRDAVGEFITRYGSRIRRRVRGKLGPTMRRIFDSQEILSTVGRRLDMYVRSGRVVGDGVSQLWALVYKMAERAVIDKARVFRRLEAIEGEDGEFATQFGQRLRQADREGEQNADNLIDECFESLTDPIDREILVLWFDGKRHTETAAALGMAPTAVRKRWEKIKRELRDQLTSHN